jgi:hypothetical protein
LREDKCRATRQDGELQSVNHPLDLTSKLAVIYLMISALVFLVLAIRFLPILRQLRASVTVLRTENTQTAHADGQHVNAENPARHQFRGASAAIEAALLALRKWIQLTALVLLAYSATEIADLLRGISLNKMIGISALSGSLAQIALMWMFAFWLMVALWIAHWILSHGLTRGAGPRTDSFR